MIINSQEGQRNVQDVLPTLHPASPDASLCCNYNTIQKPEKLKLRQSKELTLISPAMNALIGGCIRYMCVALCNVITLVVSSHYRHNQDAELYHEVPKRYLLVATPTTPILNSSQPTNLFPIPIIMLIQ